MRNRKIVWLSAMCSAALLLATTPADAQSTKSQLDAARRRATEVKSEYERIADAYADAEHQLQDTQTRLGRTKAEISRAEGDIGELKEQLKDRVRTQYRMRGLGFFHFLLEAESFRDFSVRLMSLQRQSLEDEGLILQLRKKRAELELREAELDRQQDAYASQKAAYEAQGRRLTISLSQANKVVADLKGRLAREQIQRLFSISRSTGGGGGGGRVIPLTRCPVDPPNVVTNSWGASRGGGSRRHKGNDIMASHGTPIRAVNGGTVTRTGSGGLGGISLYLWDGANEYYYAHLAKLSVSSGQKVSAGALVGTNGDTGNARGGPPHLHFEIHPGGGAAIDPYPSLSQVC